MRKKLSFHCQLIKGESEMHNHRTYPSVQYQDQFIIPLQVIFTFQISETIKWKLEMHTSKTREQLRINAMNTELLSLEWI